jgi:protein SCO1
VAGVDVDKSAALLGFAALVALIGGGYGYYRYQLSQDPYGDCRSGLAAGDIGGPFTLVDDTGATVTDDDVITKPSLIYFGYTFCPDVCPFDAARNAEAVDILEERGIEVTPVFITIDPARDTPQVLAEFTENIHPAMIGLTGSEEQIKAASTAYRTLYQRRETGDEYYLMDHSVMTYLVLPEVGYVDFFNNTDTPDQIAERVACFVGA